MAKHYVVYGYDRLRDGLEEWARVFGSLDAALEYANKDRFAMCNMEFRLFELGKEIQIEKEEIEEPQPAKVTTRYKLSKRIRHAR